MATEVGIRPSSCAPRFPSYHHNSAGKVKKSIKVTASLELTYFMSVRRGVSSERAKDDVTPPSFECCCKELCSLEAVDDIHANMISSPSRATVQVCGIVSEKLV